MSTQAPRQASKIITRIRNWLMKRDTIDQLRYENTSSFAKRTTEMPNLPGGVSTKMSANDYHTRDARSMAEPPQVIFTFQNKLLTGGGDKSMGSTAPGQVVPGKLEDFGRYIPYERSKNFHGTVVPK